MFMGSFFYFLSSHRKCHWFQLIIYYVLFCLQACGVDFEVKAYLANAADNANEVIEKKYVEIIQHTEQQSGEWGDCF